MNIKEARETLKTLERYIEIWDRFFGLIENSNEIDDDAFEHIIDLWHKAKSSDK